MTLKVEEMVKEQAKLRLGLYGPSGGGKTLTSLRLALFLAGGDPTKVGVIDTENRSAAKYADKLGTQGRVKYVPLPVFTSENYLEALRLLVAEKCTVIVIDSFSHAWEGAGGILDRQTSLTEANRGDSQKGWNLVKQFEKQLWNGVLSTEIHLIVTMRSRNEWHFFEENGKKKREIVGLEPVQRKGTEYEFDVMALMEPVDPSDQQPDARVRLTVEKSRYDEVPRTLSVTNPSEPLFQAILDAVSEGEPPEEAPKPMVKLLKDLLLREGKEEKRIADVMDAEREKNGGILPKRFVEKAIEQATRRLEVSKEAPIEAASA